jgi:DNA gyrase/topoisomerase IV subunit A
MSRDRLLTQLLEFIDSGAEAPHLTRDSVQTDTPEWYREAIVVFGGWDAYLAATLVHLRRFYETQERRESNESNEVVDEPRPERKVGNDANADGYVLARSGYAFTMALERLNATPAPQLQTFPDGPPGGHDPDAFVAGGDDSGVVLFTSGGNGLAVDARLLPTWTPDALVRPLTTRFSGLQTDERIVTALSRRVLRDQDRFYFFTTGGQLKATDMVEYRKLSSEATLSTLMREDDFLLTVVAGKTDASLAVWSSLGKGLVFDASEVRSQGRKATGVKAIGLDPGADVVSAFVAPRDGFVVLATNNGFLKRMRMSDFRPQGRAGNGLQTCRLTPSDTVACVAPVPLAGDILVLTSHGRAARFPAYDVPLMNRAARGEVLLPLDAGETLISVQGVPAGRFA